VLRSPSVAYVAPFCIFLGLLALSRVLPFPPLATQAGFVAVMLSVLAVFSRPVLQTLPREAVRIRRWIPSLLLGVGVFILWIAPDHIFPGYHHFWLFENPLMGKVKSSLPPAALAQPAVLWLRGFRAVLIVPIIEELFWRGWLMRWLISPDFETVQMGAWSAQAFWIVAVLFATEHGPFWDVGLAAGVLYNWWMLRTRSLGDLIVAHAVTNACLSVYVAWTGRWEYWL
jgi:uncharacterized protein